MPVAPKSFPHLLLSSLLAVFISTILAACSSGNDDEASPLIADVPIAYVQRSVPRDEDDNSLRFIDYREPLAFYPGAALYLKRRASASADAKNLTAAVFPANESYDVKDLSSSYDGQNLLFSMRAPDIPDADDDEQPKWNIWEYNLQSDSLRRVIESDVIAEAGHDINPRYLPDGRIVFSSTRQRGINAIRLDESKPQFPAVDDRRRSQTAVLHVMDEDGRNIDQITYNMSHDLYPSVLANGRLVFTRWQALGRNSGMQLYTANPDGTDVQLLYGNRSHDSGTGNTDVQFLKAQPQDDGQLLVQVTPFDLDTYGSNWFVINAQQFVNIDQATDPNADPARTTQTPLLEALIPTENEIALDGRYLSASNLGDGSHRYLISWNACRLNTAVDPLTGDISTDDDQRCNSDNLANANLTEGPANAALWVYDANSNSQKPVAIPPLGQMISEATAMYESVIPDYLAPQNSDENTGIVHIRSIYDMDGVDTSVNGIEAQSDPLQTDINQQSARFVRVIKGVGIPDRDTRRISGSAFGPAGQGMRQILGYVPIEPDGSVMVKVPANVPFTLSIVDAKGRRIHRDRHNSWLQLRAGETMHCHGCHEDNNRNPHGRYDAQLPSINNGAISANAFVHTEARLIAEMGETMAETLARIDGVRQLTPDLVFEDLWSDAAVIAKANSINVAFTNTIDPALSLKTPAPSISACLKNWETRCRLTINYETHIQPLWEQPRQVLAGDNVTVLEDYTCTRCHNRNDELGNIQIPAAQLELTAQSSDMQSAQLTSYRELLFTDAEQLVDGGVLVDRSIEDSVPPISDFPISASMDRNGASFSERFFSRFDNPGDNNHYQRLSTIELKLISEWLDIGAQYYNNPFEAPEN